MVDTHCHLDACEGPAAEVVERARAAGVGRIATVGINPDSVAFALDAAEAHAEVVAIVGHHPNEAATFADGDAARIEEAARHERARAIGETGLDYFRDYAPRPRQREAFLAQIELARRLDLPLVIHTREAEEDTFALLREHADGLTVVMHCFSTPGRLEECVERGYMCSFAGNVTYPKAQELQEAAREVPDELLLVETDSPWLAPQAVRGKPNEPANVVSTAEHVARLRGVDYGALEDLVERNSTRVFGW